LIGARQNRTTNRSILLPARAETEIPVSCMEHGRWHFTSRDFAPSKHQSPASVRRKSRDLEARCVKEGIVPSDAHLAMSQSEVWSEIAGLSGKFGVRSPTGALDDVYESRQHDLQEWARAFPSVEGQVGLLVLANGRPVGLDVLGAHTLYERLHQRLLSGYLLDGLDSNALGFVRPSARRQLAMELGDEQRSSESATAQRFMDRVRLAERVQAPTVGLGTYQVLAETVVGGELVEDARLGHLSAFPARERRVRGARRSG
jgi:hypothetical protein